MPTTTTQLVAVSVIDLRDGDTIVNVGVVRRTNMVGAFVVALVKAPRWSLATGKGRQVSLDVVFHAAEEVLVAREVTVPDVVVPDDASQLERYGANPAISLTQQAALIDAGVAPGRVREMIESCTQVEFDAELRAAREASATRARKALEGEL